MKVVFLDRDGVINDIGAGYITDPDDIYLIDGVSEAIKILNDKKIPVIVVTNQSIIGRRMANPRQLRKLHCRIDDLLHHETGAVIDYYLYATGTDETDNNRKPNIGMFERAKIIYPDIDVSKSWVIGDNMTDIEFGQASGLNTILVRTGLGTGFINQCSPDHIADGLYDAIEILERHYDL